MLPAAISKTRQSHSGSEEVPPMGQRRDTLFGFAELLNTRAKQAESLDLPSLANDEINEAIDQINKKSNGEAPGYLFRVAASRELINVRNWWGKFAMSVDWAGACKSDPALANLDWFISDALSNASVLQDLLGDQESLADALISLLEIADGVRSIDPEKPQGAARTEATAAKLTGLIKTLQLPHY